MQPYFDPNRLNIKYLVGPLTTKIIYIYYYGFISFTSYIMEQLKVMTRMTRYCMVGPSRGTNIVQYCCILIFIEVVQDKRLLPNVQHFKIYVTSPFLMIRNREINHLIFHNIKVDKDNISSCN